jgi:hypothetical protein
VPSLLNYVVTAAQPVDLTLLFHCPATGMCIYLGTYLAGTVLPNIHYQTA